MEMGEKIKYHRELLHMTLEELGNKVGVGKSTVRKWENGMIANMKRDKIAKVASALEISPGYLMGWTDNPDPDFPFTEEAASNMQENLDRLVGKKDGYYIDPETAKLAQRLYDNHDMRILFDAADGSKPEDIKRAADFLIMLKATNPEG